MDIGALFNLLLLQPAINIIVFILRVFEASSIPGALGWSIIALTALVKIVSWPFTQQQLVAAKKMMDLRPHLDLLKDKHKGDNQALAQAQMALYKEHGVNPAGGCLPSVIQIALIYPLYQVIEAILNPTHGLERVNYFLYDKSWHLGHLPDPHFLGFNLAHKPSEFLQGGILLLAIPLLTGALQFILSKMMTPLSVSVYPNDSKKEVKEKAKEADMASAMQSQMLIMMPLMIGFFSFQFPIGLSLYWNTLSLMGIYQQYLISGWGGFGPWIQKLKIKN
jgi:YidC/Oxa1 family membrane protein insertase